MNRENNKTKVCHMTSVHPAKDGRIFYKECCSLVKAGYDVTLVVAGAEDEDCDGVHIVGVPKENDSRINRFIRTSHAVYKKALSVDADIYHLHDPELLPYALKLKKRGKKVIFDSHEFVGEQLMTKDYIPRCLRLAVSWLYKLLEAYICRRIDTVVEVCTIAGKDYFAGRCKEQIFVTNAPIVNLKSEAVSEGKRIWNNVVHVGGLTYERGITHLARAILRVNGKLVLAGSFSSENYKREIEDICGEKIDYRGRLPLSEIQELLGECSMGTCTLLDKGQYRQIDTLPTKIYDYMLASRPIIMSNFPYLENFNKKYKVGLCVPPDNPQAIADAISYLICHPDEARRMGENGKKAVLEEFNWNSQEKILLEMYKSLSSV